MIEKRQSLPDPSARFCSFCNRSETEVGRLIEGPGIEGALPSFICEACVDLCSSILQREQHKTAAGDENLDDPAAAAEAVSRQIANVVNILDDLEFRIIELRYGLADGYSYSHEEIAGLLSITPKKVQEIEAAAVAKLKPTSS
jgi:DNA-directed RNA polymerase specialized sigma subunit